jgi:GNAT superfamily N-acetyltransferase
VRNGATMLQLRELNYENSRRYLARSRDQTTEQFVVATCADNPKIFEASVQLENETWENLSFLDFTAAHHNHYDTLLERFPEYRLCMYELETGEMIATGMCVPLHLTDDVPLPQEGWDWLVNTAVHQGGRHPNALGALSISVPEQHRHRGFARDLINAMRALAAMKGLSSVVAPVRPSAKCHHPLVQMQDYVKWVDDRGRIFDPWLRSHVAAGGQIISVCDKSMVVEQPVDFWKTWTSDRLNRSGNVVLDGGLMPLSVDVVTGIGLYVEPNVWVRHRT